MKYAFDNTALEVVHVRFNGETSFLMGLPKWEPAFIHINDTIDWKSGKHLVYWFS